MKENNWKQFDFYRFLCFPWSIFVITPFWAGIVKAIESLLRNISFTTSDGNMFSFPWWAGWILFIVGEIIIFLFLFFYSHTLPKGQNGCHNIYILIAPEHQEDDKYITSDFLECFERYSRGSIENLNIIVPGIVKRGTFNQEVIRCKHKNLNYWKTNRWNKLHKTLRGSLYISGTLKRRFTNGKETYVFNLNATIGYNDFNKSMTPLLKDELQKNFPHQILINKEFELEEFDAVSSRFATFSEYLIGWAHLVSGKIGLAYKMHYDIYTNNKQSFFTKGALKNMLQLIKLELDSIIRDCKMYSYEFVSTCVTTAERLYPNNDISTMLTARFLIMTSTDDTFDANLTRAQYLLNRVRINTNNRNNVHANRAYVHLLKGNYAKAESEYKTFFRSNDLKTIESVITYCDGQIKDSCLSERPTAFYVKALMLQHSKATTNDIEKAIKQAKKSIPVENEYYHNKLDEMSLRSQRAKSRIKSREPNK